jgi:hypothetical protein
MTGLLAAKEKPDVSKIEKRAPSVAEMFLDRVAATPSERRSDIGTGTAGRASLGSRSVTASASSRPG